MYISELVFTVDRRGSIKIPASVLEKMGLLAGDHIRVAYLTQDGAVNTFREFLLLPDTAEETETVEDDAIRIPVRLMEQANIPSESDLQIACLDGALVIFRDDVLRTGELQTVLDGLRAAEDLTSMMPGDVEQTLAQLEQVIHTIQEGAETNE